MDNRMYNPKYDRDVYKRKLNNVLNIENDPKMNGSLSQSATSKEQLKYRQPTPYHSKTSKSKLATSNFSGNTQMLINSNGSDYTDSEHDVDINNEIDISTSITSCVSNKLNKRRSKKKTVRFPVLSKSKGNSLKRESTPYHYLSNKKIKVNTCETVKNVLFSSRNVDAESVEGPEELDNVSIESLDIFSVSTSESPVRDKLQHLSNITKHEKKIRRHVNNPCKSSHKNEKYLETVYLDSDDKCENISNKRCFLMEEASDSGHSDSSELEFISDHSTSIIVDDISLNRNDDIETNEIEENEETVLGYSNEESTQDRNIKKDSDPMQDIVKEAEYYSLNDKLVIVLHNNSKLYFHGLMSVTVVQGVIEVLGYTLTSSSDCVEIFSPRGSSFLYFEKKDGGSLLTKENLINALIVIGMNSETANQLCENGKPSSAVFFCEKIFKPQISFLEKHTSQQLFPITDDYVPQCDFKYNIGTWNVLKPSSEWDSIADSLYCTSKLFICGGKSVGKSTMLRYIINKLLLKYSEILVIDLDPGQPEFTVSGCISATVVKEPVFGPNYTHLRKPSRCLFIPNINISYAPDEYLTSVKELTLSCSDLPRIPTLINYMGFTRGLGYEIFSAVVALVQPTYMVQIQSGSCRRNFKETLSYESICDSSKLFASTVDFIPPFPVCTINSMADTKQGWHLEPRQIREMCLLSYLSKRFPEGVLSLTDPRVPVYVINLSLLKIMCNGEVISPFVVNANLVALCSRASDTAYTCYGWGVVRGINLTANELFLLTPILPDELEHVDHLILGSVSLPPSLYMTSDKNTGLVPFVSQGVLTALGQIPKRSHLPPKNKQD